MGKAIYIGDDVERMLNQYRRQVYQEQQAQQNKQQPHVIQTIGYTHLTDEYLIRQLLFKAGVI